jgi:FMN reductase
MIALARKPPCSQKAGLFAASVSGLFKSFFDILDKDALTGKPVLLAATGGTARHALVLEQVIRPIFTYLRASVVPTAVFAAPEDWGGASAGGVLSDRIDRAARELALSMEKSVPPKFDDATEQPTPFSVLLATGSSRK